MQQKTLWVKQYLKEPISGHLAKESTITKEASTAEAVDLGLSVKWASCNIGANAPEKTGNYYAWGEIFAKPSYNWSSYKYGLSAEELQKYCPLANYGSGGFTDSKNTLELTDDIASTKWGEQWRIPTKSEWEELHSKCKWEWTILNGVKGYKVTSRKNNNYIFLPVTGKYNGDATSNVNTQGSYWTSTLYETYPNYAYVTRFDAKNILLAYYNRCYGLSIRPVFDSHAAHP